MPRRTMQEITDRANALGHTVVMDIRGPWPEHGDPYPKVYAKCSCGWSAKTSRVIKVSLSSVAYHYGKVVGEHDGLARNNGLASAS